VGQVSLTSSKKIPTLSQNERMGHPALGFQDAPSSSRLWKGRAFTKGWATQKFKSHATTYALRVGLFFLALQGCDLILRLQLLNQLARFSSVTKFVSLPSLSKVKNSMPSTRIDLFVAGITPSGVVRSPFCVPVKTKRIAAELPSTTMI
jgi:hypothetical protein